MEKELRYIELDKEKLEFRDDAREISGYAILYNSKSKDLGGFVEIIDKRAFDSVNFDDVYLFYQHNSNDVLGNTGAETLSLRNTEQGIYFKASLPDTSLGRDTYSLVKRGDLKGMSFGFSASEDKWNLKEEPAIRTVTKVEKLYEISVVTYPAYNDTKVSARALKTFEDCKCCKNELDEGCRLYAEAKEIVASV